MNNEYTITITTRFVEANDPENTFHENVFFFEMECLHCGVYLCPDSATAGVFAESSEIHRAVSQVWDGMDYASMIAQANEECGSRGMIDVCIYFLKKISEWTVDAFELYQNSIMNPHDNNSGVSA